MSHFSYDQVEDFGRHLLQDMVDTMRDMIKDKCHHLAKQAKQGEFDEWAALATRDIFEMRRVIRECETLQGGMTECLSNWLEKREQTETPNE